MSMKATINIATLTLLLSCEVLDYRESISPIVGTNLPPSCLAGETVVFEVSHVVFNGCGKYSRSETSREGRTVTVKFCGKYPNAGICTANIPQLETEYAFKVESKGSYYFSVFAESPA
jgi:hypothetical protein